MSVVTQRIAVSSSGAEVELRYQKSGDPAAPALLMLHGSGGAASLGDVPPRLAQRNRVLVPSHPGFDATDRPETLSEISQLAAVYSELLERLDLDDVTVVGFSLGGWVAMELAVRHPDRLGALVLVDPIGVQTPGSEILNPMTLSAEEALRANYHDAAPFLAAAASATAEQRAAQAANVAAASLYASRGLFDPELPRRLSAVTLPVLVLFGESERVVPRTSGQAIVDAVAGPAELALISAAGHRPQLEQPVQVEEAIRRFLETRSNDSHHEERS